jgi:multiple sugar transport system substrate-binding protein
MPLVLVGMAACGSQEQPGGNENSTGGAGSAPAGETVEISYLHRLPDGAGMTPVADIVDRWNAEHPDIHVTSTKFDGDAQEMALRLETDIKADSGPCLAQLGYNEVPDMYVKGLVQDVSAEADKYKANYGGAYGQMIVNGETVGLPQDVGPLVYIYNATEFANLGIEVPTTLDEFKTAAATAAAAGKYIADFNADEAGYWLSGQTAAAGGVWYSSADNQWKVTVESDASKTVADFWQSMIDAKSVLTINRWDDAYNAALRDGSLIGNIAAAWEVAFILDVFDAQAATDTTPATEASPYQGQWRVAQIPDFGAGAKTGPDGGSGVAVMKGCAYPEQAMEFNNWFNTQVDDLLSQGLVTAALEAPTTQPEKWNTQYGGQDVLAELSTANKNLNPDFAYIPGFASVVPSVVESASAVVSGSGTVADVFAAGQTASVTALTDLGLPVTEG